MEEVETISFTIGNLKGIRLNTTKQYAGYYVGGNTDKEMMDNILKDKPMDKVIFDVGAYTGASSLVFSKLSGGDGQVISFEPNKYNLERIKINLLNNPVLAQTIKVLPIALSDKKGKIKMILSKDIDSGHSSTSRIERSHSKIGIGDLPDGFISETVEARTLDEIIDKIKLVPDIIKIDIEGAEHMMLHGMTKTLKKYAPILYVEIHSEYCAIKCYEILNKFGYSVDVINEEQDNRIMIKAHNRKLSCGHKLKNNANQLSKFRQMWMSRKWEK